MSRRALLAGTGSAIGASLLPDEARALILPTRRAARDADLFDTLRLRWVAMLTGGPGLPVQAPPFSALVGGVAANAARWRRQMAEPRSDPIALWSDPLSGKGEYNSRITADRLRVLALAWATPGTLLFDDRETEADLLAALAWFERRRYSILIERIGNWWEWEMGIPLALTDLLLLLHTPLRQKDPALYDRLTAAIDRFTPAPFVGTAANRVWRSHVVMLNAIAMRSRTKIVAARDAIPTTFANIEAGDGFHADGSFIQHDDLAYTGGYGRDLLLRSALLIYLLSGSDLAFAAADARRLAQRVETSFAPFMYRGALMDTVRGRNLSRAHLSDIASGQAIIHAALYLSAATGDDHMARIAKGWISDQQRVYDVARYDPNLPAYWLTPHMARLSDDANRDPAIVPEPVRSGSYAFPAMDRFVHRQGAFAMAVSMNSARISNYESVNEENLRGWYQGAGMVSLYTGAFPNQSDDMWPTIDPYRLPGVTLDKRPRADAAKVARNESATVGSVALGDTGIAAMDVATDAGGLTARKSWFAMGGRVIALGSDIASDAGTDVETIVENRNLGDQAPRLRVDGADVAIEEGRTSISTPRWAHVEGVGGYLFDGSAPLHALLETREGSWWDINRQGASPRDRRRRRYLTLWHIHDRARDGYAYAMLPGLSSSETAEAAQVETYRVARRDAVAHAVSDGELRLTVFWRAGDAHDGTISSDGPLLAIVKREKNAIIVVVADPEQHSTGVVSLRIACSALRVDHADPALDVAIEPEGARLTLSRAGLAGRGVRAKILLDQKE